jgi:hypothetical protein
MTKTAISLLLFLPILQNNMMSSLKQSSSLIRYLQLWLKVHHQTVEGFGQWWCSGDQFCQRGEGAQRQREGRRKKMAAGSAI